MMSIIWLVTSDYFIYLWISESQLTGRVQTIKGTVFVVISCLALWWLIKMNQSILYQNRQQLQALIRNASVGLVQFTDAGVIGVNEQFRNITGFGMGAKLPGDIREVVHTGDRHTFDKMLAQLRSDPDKSPEAEVRLVTADQGYRWVLLSLSLLQQPDWSENKPSCLAAMHDITQRKQYESYTELLLEIMLSIDPAEGLKQAMHSTLRHICQKIEWDFGEAWIPQDNATLKHFVSWYRDEDRYRIFDEESREYDFMFNSGLPGIIWASSQPVWMEDVSEDERFLRRELADRCGLKSALAIPISVQDELVAVLMIFKETRVERDSELIRFFEAVGSDIGTKLERKREQEARRKSEESLQVALEAANMATWDIELPEGRISRSANHHRLYGLDKPPERWTVHTFLRHVYSEDRQRVRKAYLNAVKKGREYNLEYRAVMPDGSLKWMWTRGDVHFNDEGDADRISGVVTDIDRRKRAEQQLKTYRDRLERAQEIAQLGYWERDMKSNQLIWSDRVYDMFRLDPKTFEPSYQRFMDMVLDEDREEYIRAQRQAHSKHETMDIVYRLERVDGTIGFFHERGRVTQWINGEARRFSGVIMDVSDLKATEIELERSRRLTDAVFDTANIGIVVTDTQGRFTRINDCFSRMLGYSKDEIIGRSIDAVVADKNKLRVHQVYKKILEGDPDYPREWEVFRKDGEKLKVLISSSRLPGELGEHVQVTTVLDVTELKRTESELAKSRQLTDSILETADIGICVTDENGLFNQVNKEYCNIYGYREEELVGEPLTKVLPEESRERVWEMYWEGIYDTDFEYPKTWKTVRKDGEEIHVLISTSNLQTADNKRWQVTTVLDVTEQKRTEQQLRASEHKYRLQFKSNPLPMWIFDPETLKFIEVNNATVRQYGYTRAEFEKMTLKDITPPDEVDELAGEVARQRGRYVQSSNWTHIWKDGTRRKVEIIASDFEYDGHSYRLVLSNDVTEQKEAEKRELEALVRGEDRERRRIAHDLHDGLGQYLTAAQLNINALQKQADQLDAKRREQLQSGLQFIRQALEETRSIALNLMPKAIDDYGLILALESLVKQYQKSSEITIAFYHNVDEQYMPDQVAVNLYRIAQEALNNAIRHSEARNVTLQLMMHDDELIFTYEDDGKGFDRQKLSRRDRDGLGMHSIQTRTRSMSADLSIDSRPGHGTTVTIEVPL